MCVVVVVVVVVFFWCVEWLYFSNRIIVVRWADLSDFLLIFVRKMCVFVSRPIKVVTFLRKNGETPKRVVDFPLEKRHILEKKNMEIVRDFDEKNDNNGKPW